MKSKFLYTTYIKTTPEKLWKALTTSESIKQCWGGLDFDTDWQPQSTWSLKDPEGTIMDTGEIIEISRPKRIALKWRVESIPEMKDEGFTRCTLDLEPRADAVKLTVTHEMDVLNSKTIEALSGGWPLVISNYKSFLETGHTVVRGM